MQILDICRKLNNFDGQGGVKFVVDGTLVGICSPTILELVQHPLRLERGEVHLQSGHSEELELMLRKFKDSILSEAFKAWRNELYNVYGENIVLLQLERSICSYFGVRTYGCHLNGYTLVDGEMKMWIGKRALNKSTYPGMLDQMVAGGLTAGSTPIEIMIKECYEEAGLIPSDCKDLKAVGCISFWCQPDNYKIQAATNYTYDLELPSPFKPVNVDQEVDSFHLMTIPEVRKALESEQFKPDASIVLVDFLIRHGYISNTEPGYTEICSLIHQRFPFPDPCY